MCILACMTRGMDLKFLRLEAHLTQQQVADRMATGRAHVAQIEARAFVTEETEARFRSAVYAASMTEPPEISAEAVL